MSDTKRCQCGRKEVSWLPFPAGMAYRENRETKELDGSVCRVCLGRDGWMSESAYQRLSESDG